jgi:hypothetical protein
MSSGGLQDASACTRVIDLDMSAAGIPSNGLLRVVVMHRTFPRSGFLLDSLACSR